MPIRIILPLATVLAAFMAGMLFVHRVWSAGDTMDYMAIIRSIQNGDWAYAIGWRYPLGYPVLAATLLDLFGLQIPWNLGRTDPAVFRIVPMLGIVAFCLMPMVVVCWAKQAGVDYRLALAASVLLALNQIVAVSASVIGTDVVFLPLALTSLALWERAFRNPECKRNWIIAVLMNMLALTVREVAFTLSLSALALAGWMALRGRRSFAPWISGGIVLGFYGAILWMRGAADNFHVAASADPLDTGVKVSLLEKVFQNVLPAIAGMTDCMIPKVMGGHGLWEQLGLSIGQWPFAFVVVGLVAVGLARWIASDGLRVSHLFLLANLGIILLWPHVVTRYFFPVLAILLMCLLVGIGAVVRSVFKRPGLSATGLRPGGERPALFVASVIAAWLLLVNVSAGVKNVRNMMSMCGTPPWNPDRYLVSREDDFVSFMATAQWIGSNTPPDAVVYTVKPLYAELASARTSLYYSIFRDSAAFRNELVAKRAGEGQVYLLKDGFHYHARFKNYRDALLAPLLQDSSLQMEVVYKGDRGFELYRVR